VNTTFPWPVHPAAELFPLLGDDELAELAADIKANGLHEPVWLWRDPGCGDVLLDGRNRARACMLAGVPLGEPQYYRGDDPDGFSVSQNLRRRHLNPGQIAFITLALKRRYEATTSVGRPRQDEPETSATWREFTPPRERKSSERAAQITGASGRSVERAERVERNAPDLAEQVMRGKTELARAERIIRDRVAQERRIAEARREAEAQPEPTIVDIRVGDFREALADLKDIDAIITDPPYPHEYIPLLGDLAAWADKVLKPDGVLAVLMGQFWLPEVYRLLDGHRPYRWTACYLTPGNGYAAMGRKVQSNWKPLLIYGGGPSIGDIFRADGTGDAGAKSMHKWGQDYGAFHTIVERLTSRGQTVCDPFMGSGTTLLAAHALGRHAIGADIDAASVATARERLA
jgi:16S rRNA G966 N2-methylase RsmD